MMAPVRNQTNANTTVSHSGKKLGSLPVVMSSSANSASSPTRPVVNRPQYFLQRRQHFGEGPATHRFLPPFRHSRSPPPYPSLHDSPVRLGEHPVRRKPRCRRQTEEETPAHWRIRVKSAGARGCGITYKPLKVHRLKAMGSGDTNMLGRLKPAFAVAQTAAFRRRPFGGSGEVPSISV